MSIPKKYRASSNQEGCAAVDLSKDITASNIPANASASPSGAAPTQVLTCRTKSQGVGKPPGKSHGIQSRRLAELWNTEEEKDDFLLNYSIGYSYC